MREYYMNTEYLKVHEDGAASAWHPTNPEKRHSLGDYPSLLDATAYAVRFVNRKAEACQLCGNYRR